MLTDAIMYYFMDDDYYYDWDDEWVPDYDLVSAAFDSVGYQLS